MSTVASPNRIRDWAVAFGLVIALLVAGPLLVDKTDAQSRKQSIDFLNERLKIPDSSRFTEGEYIESGVGVPFGVDKRLSYFSGNYAESITRFSEALRRYPYKAEIWVFLARSFFYEKVPEEAKRTIERAAEVMPDLAESFWDPLLESMLGEIHNRALEQQAQIDFYTRSQEEFLELFRLFRFLVDENGMVGIVLRADAKAAKMSFLATMVSADSRTRYRAESDKWVALAEQMRGEMRNLGFSPPEAVEVPVYREEEVPLDDADLLEQTHQLQLKVDFYQPLLADFSALFENYLALDLPDGARFVLEGLQREAGRVRLQADTANDFAMASQYGEEADALDALREELLQRLPDSGP